MATVSGFIGCKTLGRVATVDDIKSQNSIFSQTLQNVIRKWARNELFCA